MDKKTLDLFVQKSLMQLLQHPNAADTLKKHIWTLDHKMTYFTFPKSYKCFRFRGNTLNTFLVERPFRQVS